jgi:hypothetical protein
VESQQLKHCVIVNHLNQTKSIALIPAPPITPPKTSPNIKQSVRRSH